MIYFTAPYHSTWSPPRKKQRLSVMKRYEHVMEFSTRNEKFQIPKRRVRFYIPDIEKQKPHDGQGCSIDCNVESMSSDNSTKIQTATKSSSGSIILSNEEIKSCWYDRSDMMGFRQEAINHAFFQLKKSNGDEASLPRGMESLAPSRRKHKTNALRYILLAIRSGKDQNFVRGLCAKLGRWNKDIAIRHACIDYLDIYRPFSVNSVPPLMSKPPKIPHVPDSIAEQFDLSRSKVKESSIPTSPSSKKRKLNNDSSECPNLKTFQ